MQSGVPNLLDEGILFFGREAGLDAMVPSMWTMLDEVRSTWAGR